MGQGWGYCWRHYGFDLGLPDAELSDVQIYEQADADCVALPDLRRDGCGQGCRYLVGACDPVLDRIILYNRAAVWVSLVGLAIFVAAAPARNVPVAVENMRSGGSCGDTGIIRTTNRWR
jgi:hypothetical protein